VQNNGRWKQKFLKIILAGDRPDKEEDEK